MPYNMEAANIFIAGTGSSVLLKDKDGFVYNKKKMLKCNSISVWMCKHAKQEKCYKTVRVKGDAESHVLGSTAVIMGDLPTHTHMVDVKKIVMKAVESDEIRKAAAAGNLNDRPCVSGIVSRTAPEDLELISSRDSIRKRISRYILSMIYISVCRIHLYIKKLYIQLFLCKIKF